MSGSIRVGNKRKGAWIKPYDDETVVDVDRANPILGNKHILNDPKNDLERMQVIERYKVDYEKDWEANGPMALATYRLAKRVRDGEKIILQCWCAPKDCHGDLIVEKVKELLGQKEE